VKIHILPIRELLRFENACAQSGAWRRKGSSGGACGELRRPPTIVGGADLAMKLGKLALLQPSGSRHPEPEVAALEKELEELINASGVGPMGLGGKTRVLAVHVEYAHRHPASLPLGIVVQCWAHHRATVRIAADGSITPDRGILPAGSSKSLSARGGDSKGG